MKKKNRIRKDRMILSKQTLVLIAPILLLAAYEFLKDPEHPGDLGMLTTMALAMFLPLMIIVELLARFGYGMLAWGVVGSTYLWVAYGWYELNELKKKVDPSA